MQAQNKSELEKKLRTMQEKLQEMKVNNFKQLHEFVISLSDYYETKFPNLEKAQKRYYETHPFRTFVSSLFHWDLNEKNDASYVSELKDILNEFCAYLGNMKNEKDVNDVRGIMKDLANDFDKKLKQIVKYSNKRISHFLYDVMNKAGLLLYDMKDNLSPNCMHEILEKSNKELLTYGKKHFRRDEEAHAIALTVDGHEEVVSMVRNNASQPSRVRRAVMG